MDDWSPEWPEERGWFWAYGNPWKNLSGLGVEPELNIVQVRGTATGFAYITRGTFLFKGESGPLLWKKAIIPELPTQQYEEIA
jgi:hypothetical protein